MMAMNMARFNTEEQARAFVQNETTDGVIIPEIENYIFDENGKKHSVTCGFWVEYNFQ